VVHDGIIDKALADTLAVPKLLEYGIIILEFHDEYIRVFRLK
jgi:hypothetical protein